MESKNQFKYILVFFYSLFTTLGISQDLEATYQGLKEKINGPAFKMNGGLNASLLGAYTNADIRRADPFAWRLNGQVQFDFYGIKMPVSLVMSSRSTVFNYQLPSYTFVGLRPSYRWVGLHLGNSQMTFSPYTLSGHGFQGVGIELKPGIWRLSAMRGQLKRATAKELDHLQQIDLSFRRMAWGIKAGIDTGKEHLALTLFQAADQINSLPSDSLHIKPMANLVMALEGKKTIGPNLFVDIDYAMSFLTRDRNSLERIPPPRFWQNKKGLFDFRNSTGIYKALKTSIGVKTNFGNIQFHHEWIDPGYRSLGTLFFNDDLENITASSTFSLWHKTLNVHANIGIQRNNLSGFESNTSQRVVGTLNATYTGVAQLTLNGNFSNFSSTNRLRSLSDPLNLLDSIKLVLVNQQMNLAANYTMGNTTPSVFSAMFSYQKGNAIQNDEVQITQQNQYYMGQLSHTYTFGPKKISLTSGIMVNKYKNGQLNNSSMAPSIALTIPFWQEQLKWSTVFSYLHQSVKESKNTGILNWQNQASFSWKKKHRLVLQAGLISRWNKSGQASSFLEGRGRLTYAWTF